MGPHANGVYMDNVSCAVAPGDVDGNQIQGDADGAEVEVWVTTPFTTSAGGTLQLTLKHGTVSGTVNTVAWQSKVYAVAELGKSGKEPLLRISVPRGLGPYTKLTATIGTGAMTAGTLHAHLINRQM